MAGPVYLDYNATTPIAPEVQAAIVENLDNWGNPSSPYAIGQRAKNAVQKARGQLADMLEAKAEEIIFTSGGTESNHLAILSAIHKYRQASDGVPHVVTTNVEHCAITQPLLKYEEQGLCTVTFVPVVKGTGRVNVVSVLDSIQPTTCLVTIMLANNETGIIQPVQQIFNEIEKLNKERAVKILVHTDAAQAIGKIKVSVKDLKADMLTIVGHKFYGPRIGALYCKDPESNIQPMFWGGNQEKGYRSGTENVAMIAGLGAAAQLVIDNIDSYTRHLKNVRDYMRDGLMTRFQLVLNEEDPKLEKGEVMWRYVDSHMLPNTLSVRFGGLTGNELLANVEDTLQASTGAACHSGGSVSKILINSWNWSEQGARQTVRLSVGRETTRSQVDRVLDAFSAVLLGDEAISLSRLRGRMLSPEVPA
eukprot:TRINITY_DN19439_c0_g1_i3.p1 TRINITY_DN19439_c0_g1~~TRINITY_DN19439_c0_g1_i3.p1  ORF type:complete len:420 (+),score=75.04 TRINITY_DN19439_c0_g1_i3:51-1310(+)